MPSIGNLIAARRQYFDIRTRVSRKSSFLALTLFQRVLRRHMAYFEARDKLAFSTNFKGTLRRFASIPALKRLYPFAQNIFGLRYLDFVYWQIFESLEDIPMLDIAWNEPWRFEDICRLPNSCIILILHNGFAHGTRALSYSNKRLAAVIGVLDAVSHFYRRNKINHPEDIEIVPVNSETLLKLADVAKSGKAIICAPDLVNPTTGRCNLLSMGMFHFAGYANLPLYYFDFYMDEDCILRGFIKGPIDLSLGPVKAAEDFIRFCKSISGRNLMFAN